MRTMEKLSADVGMDRLESRSSISNDFRWKKLVCQASSKYVAGKTDKVEQMKVMMRLYMFVSQFS